MIRKHTEARQTLSDYHVHTSLCRHAEGLASEYLDQARLKNIPELCFTDHAPNPHGYDPANRMALEDFPAYQAMIRPLQKSESPRVLFGVEADYYPGGLDFLRQWLAANSFDFVLGSVHYVGDWGIDSPSEMHRWRTADVPDAWRKYFLLLADLADTRLFDAVGHLDLPKKFGFVPPEQDIAGMAGPALDRIAEAGMSIEVNTAVLRKPIGEIYPSPLLLRMARERGITICFGSDAHKPGEVGFEFPAALRLAREAGYTHAARYSRRRRTLVPLPNES